VSLPRQLPRLRSSTAPTHSDPSTSMSATRLEAVKMVAPPYQLPRLPFSSLTALPVLAHHSVCLPRLEFVKDVSPPGLIRRLF
jgi:hypothetical protein